jgi:hypothetical protein
LARLILVHDRVVARALPRIARAAALTHSGRSFLEHLLCTWRILVDWHLPTAVCRAGFLHSAYSTSHYGEALFRFDEREDVRGMIGPEAEELVYRFCAMDRRDYWDQLARMRDCGPLAYPDRRRAGARVRISRTKLAQLLMIESANVAEQSRAATGGPAPWMSRVFGWWRFLDADTLPVRFGVLPALTKRADERAIDAYEHALAVPLRRAVPLLEEAIDQNPWAAEPRIMRALCERSHTPARRTELAKSVQLLSGWAVAWDKRLSANGWRALCRRMERASRDPSREPTFESVRAVLSRKAHKPRFLAV